ncbi:MAG: aldehyde ferredoxin oxidoreductase C-terminal domain-containing protein [Geobacteraceae bacterium]|nr:aldehyde ferredoxin oxidoreductase C-terminal domain-containing protein [Geobacteraceae bacterium]
MDKIVRIDMTGKSFKAEPVTEKYTLFGGRGLIAKILCEEVNPTCDALGPENKLIFCSGLLGDTPAPCSGRLSIGGKSPLTGGIKEANSGGTFAQRLVSLGLKALIIEGQPKDDEWSLVFLGENTVELLPADKYLGMNNYELTENLRQEYGDKISIASIGCAGERGYRNSTIQITDLEGHPSRAAARGGLGSVMGSKKIKAIIIKASGKYEAKYQDKAKFVEKNRQFVKEIIAHPFTGQGLPALGTAMLVNPMNGLGILPTNNFSSGTFEYAEDISGEKIAELQATRGGVMKHTCHRGCIVQCSQIYNDAKGEYLTSGFEYETIGLVGANCGIRDIDLIAQIDRMCDDLGVDTMDTGCTIGVAMEAGKIPFGDGAGALMLVQEMKDGTTFGRLLGDGTERAGKAFGVKRIPTVKGQAMAAYDPRGLKGTGITYATSTMGADHTAGNTISMPGNPADKEGKVEASRNCQVGFALLDNLGLCIFVGVVFENPDNIQCVADMVGAKFGDEWDINKLMGIAVQNLSLEKQFNREAGFTSQDDRLPEFFYQEALPNSGHVFDLTDEELDQTLPF